MAGRHRAGRSRRSWILIAAAGAMVAGGVTPPDPPTAPAGSVPAAALPDGPALAPVPGAAPDPLPVRPVGLREGAAVTTALPDGRAAVAVRAALDQIGLPYVWGGNGPGAGHRGFDCSGLTTYAYRTAGIALPRTAHTQYHAGPRVPGDAPLQPGDLVFYGSVQRVHHVGMYLGAGRMVNAPTFGKPVQTAYYRWRGDDYLGASRPAATGTGPALNLPLPELPPLPREIEVFAAPAAPLPPTPLPQPGDPAPPEGRSAAAAIAAADLADPVGEAPDPPGVPGDLPGSGTTAFAQRPAAEPGSAPLLLPEDPATEPASPSTSPPRFDDRPTGPALPPAPGARATDPAPTGPPVARPGDPLSAPAAAPAEPGGSAQLDLAGVTLDLRAVRRSDGLPAGPGISVEAGSVAVRLADPGLLDRIGLGAALSLRSVDSPVTRYRVTGVHTVDPQRAAELVAAGPLVLLAPAADDWLVLTVTPG